jgi:hypothetical protein
VGGGAACENSRTTLSHRKHRLVAPDFRVPGTFHVTVDADGNVTAFVDRDSATCTG